MRIPPEKAEEDEFLGRMKESSERRRELLLSQKRMRTPVFWEDEKIVE